MTAAAAAPRTLAHTSSRAQRRWGTPHHQAGCGPPRRVRPPVWAAGGSSGGSSVDQPPPSTHKVGRMNRLLQNVNLAGTSLFFQIATSNQGLALPHVSVPDISWIDWAALARAGFKAVVFDKDNTLCEPFALQVPPRLQPSFAACRAAFGPASLVLYSNSAGLAQYDPAGEEAAALEAAFGVHVLRHADKKPAGGCAELSERCGCQPHEMVFVGDRYLTDVVFGNRHGMLTIRVAPLTAAGEPVTVAGARRVEEACVQRWSAGGVRAPPHRLLPQEQAGSVVVRPPQQPP